MQVQEKNNMQKNPSSIAQFHLSDYIAIVKKRKWVIIIFSVVLISIVTAISLISPHIYEATAQIIIERRPYAAVNVGESIDREVKDQDFYMTQYNLLQSRSLAMKVIGDLKLDENMLPKGIIGKDSALAIDKSSLVDGYLDSLKIEPVTGTHLVNISFHSMSPATSALVANAHAKAFIEWISDMKISASQQGLSWLNEHLKEQKDKYEESQQLLNDYKKLHGIVSFEDRQNIVSQKLMELNTSLTRVKTERLSKQATYDQLKTFSIEKENIFSLPEVARDTVIQNLRNQLIQVKSKRLEMAANYGPRHPKMIEADASIRQLEQEITEEVRRLGKNIKAELDRAIAYEKSIQQTLDGQKAAALSQNDKAVRYDVLQQDAQSNQKIYESLLKQAKEMGLASVVENSSISIVDAAEIPDSAVRPKTFINILLAVIVSMFMGPFMAFFTEYMDRTVRTPEDIQKRLGLPVFGVVPSYKRNKKDNRDVLVWDDSFTGRKEKSIPVKQLLPHPDGPQGKPDPFRVEPGDKSTLSDMVNRFIPGFHISRHSLQGKSLYISSAAPGEGKSTIVANSAIGLASSGRRVVVIDADIEHPSLHHSFGITNGKGMTVAMEEILMNDINQGSLSKYSIDDILFLIDLKKYTGRLTVVNGSQSITTDFENGAMFHIQNHGESVPNKLGEMLLRSGHITKEQLETALDWNRRTGQPLGYILINTGSIARESLQGMLKLQMEENLQKLFSWKQGDFHFDEIKYNINTDEKIYFGDTFSSIAEDLSATTGNRFIEERLFANIEHIVEHNVWLLPVGSGKIRPHNPSFMKLLAKLLNILKGHFDIILIDAPPVTDIPNAVPLASLCEGVIFVIKAGKLSDKVIKEATSKLQESGSNILGVVLNQAEMSKEYYYYNQKD